ncbi:MAG: hypothetical protein ABL955_09240, partial [Elusimicrobiota bacterium]
MKEEDEARLAKAAMRSLLVPAPESLKADLKRLARKGYIKITTIPRSRIKYLLTQQGFTEK